MKHADGAVVAFDLGVHRFGLAAESTVFIDDSPANVAVARSMGFEAIEFESADQVRRNLVSRGFPLVDRRPDSPS